MQPANNKLDLRHYIDMAAKNHRGLIPMVFAKTILPYAQGAIAGFRPEEAKALHDDGIAVPHQSVYEAGAVETKAGASAVVDATEDDRRRSAVDLGDDPLSAHQLDRIKMAQALSGADVGSPEAADTIIKGEIERRQLTRPTPDQLASNAVATQINPASAPTVTSQTVKGKKAGSEE